MAFSLLPLSTVGIIGTVLIACYLLYGAALPRPILGIPYNKASAKSIFGDIPAVLKHTQETSQVFDWMVAQCVKLNSPIVQIWSRPLGRPWVVVADFREGQDILMRRVKEFDRSKYFSELFIGIIPYHHITMPSNDIQKKQRRLLADTMSVNFLQDIAAPQIYAAAMDLLDVWRLKSTLAEGHPWSAPGDIYHSAMDAIWAVTFGTHPGASKSQLELISTTNEIHKPRIPDGLVEFPKAPMPPSFDAIVTLTSSIETTVQSPIPKLHHWLLRQLPRMRYAKGYKDRYITEALHRACGKFSGTSDKDELVNSAVDHLLRRELIAAKKNGRDPEFNTPAIRDELFGFLVGGHDTTSTAITWGLKFLTDHQKVQQRLRKALRASFAESFASNTSPSATEIVKSHIPYLDATLEEILRCAMTAPGQVRDATCDTEILGYRIPKGTTVFCLSNGPSFMSAPFIVDENLRSGSSRDAKERTGVWDVTDMKLFLPERWLALGENGEEVFDPRAGPNVQFGFGPRGCFGRRLAEMELRLVIVLLVWTFDLQPTPEELSGYGATDGLTHMPHQCFVRLGLAK